MNEMFDLIQHVGGILPDWAAALFGLMVLAKVFVALTPTPADDAVYGKVYKAIEMLALNFGRAKDKAPEKK